jgi:hypothetical protein
MKAKVLKSFNSTTTPSKEIKEGDIVEVDAPIGGVIKEVFYKAKKLIVGTDVELIFEEDEQKEMNKQQKGGVLFYGALAIMGYIVYKVLTTK